jgi:hypothetical protein
VDPFVLVVHEVPDAVLLGQPEEVVQRLVRVGIPATADDGGVEVRVEQLVAERRGGDLIDLDVETVLVELLPDDLRAAETSLRGRDREARTGCPLLFQQLFPLSGS